MSSELKNETAAATETATATKIPAGEHAEELTSLWDDEVDGLALTEEAAGPAPEMAEFTGRDELLRSIEALRLLEIERVDRYGDKSPPANYWSAPDRVVEAGGEAADGAIDLMKLPERAHVILWHVLSIARELAKFRKTAISMRPAHMGIDDEVPLPAPSQGLLGLMDLLFKAADEIDTPPDEPCRLESIEELKKQGLTDNQIAAVYDVPAHVIRREVEKPGSAITGSFVSPVVRQRFERRQNECKQLRQLPAFATIVAARRKAIAAGLKPDFI